MRIISALSTLILGLSVPATLHSQSTALKDGFVSHTEVALDYNYVRSSTAPAPTGQTSAFTINGVSATGAYLWRSHISLVADFSGTHVNGIENTGRSFTLLTSTVGGRYTFRSIKRFLPFAQVLAGEAHAMGSVYPSTVASSGGADSVAIIVGGGVDHPLNHVVSLRLGAAYLYTGLPNVTTSHQSDLRADGGLVIHFGGR